MNKVVFFADGVRVNGPKASDGSFSITFDVGEYLANQVADVLQIPRGVNLKVTIEYGEEEKNFGIPND